MAELLKKITNIPIIELFVLRKSCDQLCCVGILLDDTYPHAVVPQLYYVPGIADNREYFTGPIEGWYSTTIHYHNYSC